MTRSVERTVFRNPVVFWFFIISFSVGILLSGYLLLASRNAVGVLRLLWMSALLFLVITKHRNAKINLKWWVIITLIVGPAFSLLGRLLNEMVDGFTALNLEFYLIRLMMLVVGLILLNYIRETITVERVEKE